MAVLIACYCGKETQLPESLCGQPGVCPDCGLKYTLPSEFAELDRPILPPDLTSSTIIVLHCECGESFDVQLKHSGRQLKCLSCDNILGIPEIKIPEANYVGEEGKYWSEKGKVVSECLRCNYPIHETDKYCNRCGAHPLTGLTLPESEDIWINYSESLEKSAGVGAGKTLAGKSTRISSYSKRGKDRGKDKSPKHGQRQRPRRSSRSDKHDRRR